MGSRAEVINIRGFSEGNKCLKLTCLKTLPDLMVHIRTEHKYVDLKISISVAQMMSSNIFDFLT